MSDAVVKLTNLARSFEQGGVRIDVLQRRKPDDRAGRNRGACWPVRLRQIDDVAGSWSAGRRFFRQDRDRREGCQRAGFSRAHDACAAIIWASSTSSIICCRTSPRAKTSCCRSCCSASAAPMPWCGPNNCSAPWGWNTAWITAPASFRAESNNALPWRARWSNKPQLVLADEPTGNLDEKTSERVLGEFLELVRGQGSAALVATHNERLAARMDRVVRLHEGRIE